MTENILEQTWKIIPAADFAKLHKIYLNGKKKLVKQLLHTIK